MTGNNLLKKPKPNFNTSVSSRFAYRLFKRPHTRQVSGDIRIGYIKKWSIIFGLRKKELTQHLLAIGRSGAGKTNLLRLIQLELHRIEIPFLAFDLAKYGNRYILDYIPDLIILRWDKEFFFNPLMNPPGVKLKEWLMAFTEISTDLFGLRTASKMFLTEFILKLFEKYEAGKFATYPTMHDLNCELEKKLKAKIPINERGYINGIKSKIKAICITLEEMINIHEGIPIEKLLEYPVCIELVGIKSSEIQIWIISLILAWIASYREARQMSFGTLKHVLIFDEAAKLVGKGEK